MKKDGYSRQIDRLRRAKDFTGAVQEDWNKALGLFRFAGQNTVTTGSYNQPNRALGCLTMVRCGTPAASEVITQQIIADQRIPSSVMQITPESLLAFAEWQRRFDKEFNRPRYSDRRADRAAETRYQD